MAIQEANLLAGNLAKETMRPGWYTALGLGLFSRSYTSTVIRQVTRAFTEDKVLAASLKEAGVKPAEIERALNGYQKELRFALMLDYAAYQIQSNALNYFMTGASNEPDKNGKPGAHLIYENKGNTTKDAFAPERVFITRNEDGSSFYLRSPNRTTLDQLLFLEGVGEAEQGGDLPRWVRNKANPLAMGVARQIGIRDYGKPMGDTAATVANVASSYLPTRELPWELAESFREGNADLVKSAFMTELSKTLTTIPGFVSALSNTMGAQVREYPPGYEESKGTGEGYKKEQMLRDRISEIKPHWDDMTPEQQGRVEDEIRQEAQTMGVLPKDVTFLMKTLRRGKEKSPHGERQGESFKENQ
jgi:hypothetical protein